MRLGHVIYVVKNLDDTLRILENQETRIDVVEYMQGL